MTFILFSRPLLLLAVTFATASVGITAVRKKVPVATAAASHKGFRKKGSRTGRKRSAATAQTWRNRQAAPSSDRYREIQQALVGKGYLKSEPSGVWDSQSAEAMKQFQTDQKLSPSGKINSASLIGLGLGPKHNAVPATSHAVPNSPGESPLTP